MLSEAWTEKLALFSPAQGMCTALARLLVLRKAWRVVSLKASAATREKAQPASNKEEKRAIGTDA